MSEHREKIEQMQNLIVLLNQASRAYYQESREIMSNFEYDRLYDELLDLEKETGTILAGSPTQKVGYEILSELPKEAHESMKYCLICRRKHIRPGCFPWIRPKTVISW